MPRSAPFPTANFRGRAAIALAILALTAMLAGDTASAAKPSKRVAAKAQNATLGKTVLTSTKGRTLYSLSAEKNGKFICTGPCLSVWLPLVVPAGVRPTGPVKLGTTSRPDGNKVQVTYRGRPLYRFAGDSKPGDVNGEGIKDVGTWRAATLPANSTPQPQPPSELPSPYPLPYEAPLPLPPSPSPPPYPYPY